MYQFIVNPNAQGGRGIRIWKKMEGQLKRAGVEYHAHLTERCGDARTFASQLTDKKDPCCIVVVGGDGTLSEVVDGLSFSPVVTLGYVPVGFTNDFARSIRLPRKAKACLKRIINPKQVKMMDYGVITYGDDTIAHRRFLVSTGIGLDSVFCQQILSLKTEKKLRFFRLKWMSDLIISMKQIVRFTPVRGYLLLDGIKKVEFNRLYFVSANIHPFSSGGFKLAPKANYSDGKITICVIHSAAKIHLLPIYIRAKFGNLGKDRGVRFYECKEAAIHLDQARAVYVDGVFCQPQTDLQIRCIEKKLRVIK